MRRPPTDEQLARLDADFADVCLSGSIERTEPLPAEVAGNDQLDLARIVLRFDSSKAGRLRELIDRLNDA
jgi:hypothetical protein